MLGGGRRDLLRSPWRGAALRLRKYPLGLGRHFSKQPENAARIARRALEHDHCNGASACHRMDLCGRRNAIARAGLCHQHVHANAQRMAHDQSSRVAHTNRCTKYVQRTGIALNDTTSLRDKNLDRRRLAIVVQRYGSEINGGAELHARTFAQRLSERYDVDVLTTCALDNRRWDHAFAAGESFDGNVRVLRFSQKPRGSVWQRRTPWSITRLIKRAQSGVLSTPFVPPSTTHSTATEMDWLAAQGPECEPLAAFLEAELPRYSAVFVYSLRYWTAVRAVQIAKQKAILTPTLHDEKAMYRSVFGDALASASAVLFNTQAERALADRLYGRTYRHSDTVGVGINLALPEQRQRSLAKTQLGLDAPYVIYTGRINEAKGCDVMIRAFEAFRGNGRSDWKLLLLGRIEMKLPQRDWLVAPGFVDVATRDGALADALALVLPSQFESLSLSTLEAMAFGVPVIVNGKSDALVGHVAQSQTGYVFDGAGELADRFVELQNLHPDTRKAMATRSQAYVRDHYSWPIILDRLERAIAQASGSKAGERAIT
jgi:glycosyltransferase involved in cell wall biosynthesis